MAGDLDGLLVVSVEQAVAAPYLSGKLAEAGARVLKIERPEGDFARQYDAHVMGESAYFVWLNRGKESVCLDLKAATDKALLAEMIARADVFIQNLAPGAMARLGFDQTDLRRRYPSLITVAISGYGDTGPLADLKAYDLLVQAESGLSAITGNAAGPARVGVSVCDIAAGVTAHQAVLQALFARARTGAGRHIAVSLFHALADWMNVPYLQHVYGGATPARAGLAHPSIAPYGVFATRDAKAILISIQNDREWARFTDRILGQPHLAHDPRMANNSARVENRAAVDGTVARHFAALDQAQLTDDLMAAGIAFGRVSDLDDLANHPQRRLVTAATPSGPVTMMAPGAIVDGRAPDYGPVPKRGAHTEAARAEFAPKTATPSQGPKTT